MARLVLDPYIFFAGNCQEAMEFYQTVFGGELRTSPYGQMGETPEGMEGKLMHAVLDGEMRIMASDTVNADTHGHGKIHLSLSGDDEPKLRGFFEALSEGGEIRQPLEAAPWGDLFGSLRDRFGVNWMVNIGSGDPPDPPTPNA